MFGEAKVEGKEADGQGEQEGPEGELQLTVARAEAAGVKWRRHGFG